MRISATLLVVSFALPACALLAATHTRHPAPLARRASTIVAKNAALPRDIKEVVNQLRSSVQSALQARLSRIDVDLPIGADFGVEAGEQKRKGKYVTSEDIRRSDRELARLFVEMFEGTGLEPLVLFSDEAQATRARELWPGVAARVAALGGPPAPSAKPQPPRKAAKKRSGGGGGGFGGGEGGAPSSASTSRVLSAVPATAEVLFCVRPGPDQLEAIRSFCEASGMDRLVILLNARVDTLPEWWAGSFEGAYAFVTDPTGAAAAAQKEGGAGADAAPAVIWRAFPDDWVVATKPKLGPPKQIAAMSARPSQPAIEAALEGAASDGGLFGLGNVF